MFLQQLFVKGLGHASYVIGDVDAGLAVVVDPRRDIAAYLTLAEEEGLRIVEVLETHVHNDYVSGAEELRLATGATVRASPDAGLARPHQRISDGDELRVGSLRFRAVATPGHTPDHLAFLVADLSRTDEDWILLSGGALLVGTAARPDLLGDADEAREAAAVLHRTLRDRIATLPDWIELYPTHGAGSLCGSGIGGKRWSTVGFERRHNPALHQPDAEAFTAFILADQPSVPMYWRRMRATNRAGPEPLASLADPRPMTAAEVSHAVGHGAVLLDARPPDDYAAGHVPGAISVGLEATFGQWAGSMIPIDRELVLVLERPEDLDEVMLQLRRAGFDRVVGELDGGMAAWDGPLATLRRVNPSEVAGTSATILDVREPNEWRDAHIPGAMHLPGAQLPFRGDDVPSEPLVLVCGSGYRSTVAASYLMREGREAVANMAGGMDAYVAADLPIEREDDR